MDKRKVSKAKNIKKEAYPLGAPPSFNYNFLYSLLKLYRQNHLQHSVDFLLFMRITLFRIATFAILFLYSVLLLHAKGLKTVATVKRSFVAQKFDGSIRVDGILNDEVWSMAEPLSNFIQYEPLRGSLPSEPTEVRVLYSNSAIYIGAKLMDSSPEEIYREFGQRDNSDRLKADVFSVLISPYNDGINYQEFMVSASGVQTDIRHTGNNRDRSWDAVWESSVALTPNGWVVEMRIPFSALRFSAKTNEKWGVNFRRLIKRYNEWSSWNPIDVSISGIVNQSGEMDGVSNIETPVRLSFTPYISGYTNSGSNGEKWNFQFNGGLDLKFGLSESFTLDMTLIPDFGQVKSDDKIFNVSPFEVKYDEQRPFFTEGMDLFSKGNVFYSRRIGSFPKFSATAYSRLRENEIVETLPTETRMVNAVKVSGRTAGGLGIGFFNAITGAEYATLTDTVTGSHRDLKTQGITNYSILVFDQTLRNNSYASIINTNLLIPDTSYSANVTATEFILRDRANKYAFRANGAYSIISHSERVEGHKYTLSFSKTSGNLLYTLWHNTESEKYNPNDMGYLQKPNEFSNGVDLGYRVYKPFWRLLNWSSWIGYNSSYIYHPRVYSSSSVYLSFVTTFAKRYFTIGGNFSANPRETHNYDEPRVNGRMVIVPRRATGGIWASSDYRKTLAFDIRTGYWISEAMDQNGYWLSLSPRIRFSNNLFVVFETRKDFENNNLGYAGRSGNLVYMGLRNMSTHTNTIEGLWAFNANASVSLRLRHYWRWLIYNNYFELNSDGTLSAPLPTDLGRNAGVSLFNIDLSYQWNFAPGSVFTIMWKNAIEERSTGNVDTNFGATFTGLLNAAQQNSISFKLLYYVDYQSIRRKKV